MQRQLRSSLPAVASIAICALLAAGLPAGRAAAQVAVYGLELEVEPERERLLVFADQPLESRLIEVDERTLMLALPGAHLDPSAPTRIAPTAQGTIRRITAFERAGDQGAPEVRVVVQRRPGEPPRLEQRGAALALDFEPLRRAAPPSQEATIPVRYRGVSIRRVVAELARAIGETVVLDDGIGGAVTVEGADRVSRGEALALLDSLLLLRGFAAVPSPGGARVVVPIPGAAGPWVEELPDSDALVTTLLRLEVVSVEDLLAAIQPYLGAQTVASAFLPTNSIILSGPASQLRRLSGMIQTLDAVDPVRSFSWPLHFADAGAVAEQLVEILGEDAVPVAAADLRTNTLLLKVRLEDLDRARDALYRLDRPTLSPGTLRVVKLRHADPQGLADLLVSMRDGGPAGTAAAGAVRAAGLQGRDFAVVVDPPTRSLVFQADPEVFSALIDVVRELDREPATVRVKVMVASVSFEDRFELGIEYLIPTLTEPKDTTDLITSISSSLGISDPSFVASFTRSPLVLTLTDPTTGAPVPIELPRERVAVTGTDAVAESELLIRPELLVTSGDEHSLFVGDNIPIPVAGGAEGANALQVQQDIQRQDVGTTVRVVPTVGAAGGVTLELDVEVSSLTASAAGSPDRVGPSLEEITVQSLIRLQPGEVAVIATAQRPITSDSSLGIPWLRSLPGLGLLFRSTRESSRKRYLLITAEADVLREQTRQLAVELERLSGPGPAARLD